MSDDDDFFGFMIFNELMYPDDKDEDTKHPIEGKEPALRDERKRSWFDSLMRWFPWMR